MRRGPFFVTASISGWRWLLNVWNHVGLALYLLALVGAGFVSFQFRWWVGLIVLVALLVALFFEGAYRVYRENTHDAAAGFPDVVLSMGGQGYHAAAGGAVISLLNVNVFNREEHGVSLTFKMYEKFKPPDEHGPLEMPLERLPPRAQADLPITVNVAPRTAVRGDFHFWRSSLNDNLSEGEGYLVRVLDHFSGELVEIASLGEFSPGRGAK